MMSDIALAMDNYPDADPNDWFEIIEGVKTMAASARGGHNIIAAKIFSAFDAYFIRNNIGAVAIPDVDVYLPDGNLFRPDLCVICESAKFDDDGKIHGVPELCVEVLSPSTAKNDLGIKMTIYARNGVKEYWIVYPREKIINVYKLSDGYYVLDGVYHSYDKAEFDDLTDAERAEVKDKIQVGIFPELFVDVDRIFKWWSH